MHGFALNDIFKIGIGPSSSHTMGPMYAAQHFFSQLESGGDLGPYKVQVTLHGSLAATGDGQFMISLDQAIDTVRETGKDMDSRYKETARGGLAIHGLKIPVTAVEC